MIWKLDDIDFKDYGVYVSKSTGVLDIPSMADNSINWLDENGNDYWDNISNAKYEDRVINLSCFILANSYSDFKSKVTAFFAALSASGERKLTTPYNTITVNLQEEVKVIPKTSYINTLQVGIFNLRLTVSGDSKTKLITIYRGDGVSYGLFKYGSDARLDKQLQGNNQITFQIEQNESNTIGRGDYIVFNTEKYFLLEYPEKEKHSTNKYVTKFTFQHQFFKIKDAQFRPTDIPESSIWGTMEDIIDLIVINANRANAGLFEKGDIVATENRNHSYSGENCYEILTKIAADYKLEWNYRVVSDVIYIDVQERIQYTSSLSFEYGKGNELHKISRKSTTRENMVTHLYPYGATKNLPASYGYPRLRLTTEPVLREFYGMHIEDTVYFDDIFPERSGTVTSYTYTAPISADKPETAIYEIIDTSMPFDLKEKDESGNTIYWISGTNPKFHFNSGDLAGYEFEVLDYTHSTKTFKIIPILDERGTYFPNATLYPGTADAYVLIDINLPQAYIDTAVTRLSEAAQDYLDLHVPSGAYTDDTSPEIYSDIVSINSGTVAHMIDADFGLDTDLRITDISINLYAGDATITLADFIQTSKRQQLELKVATIEKTLKSAKLTDVNTVRGNEQTAREVKNAIIDPLDEKIPPTKMRQKIITFTSIDTPSVTGYNASYGEAIGQYPTVKLYQLDEYGNRITRSELPYFILDGDGLIDEITFGNIGESITGFIILE